MCSANNILLPPILVIIYCLFFWILFVHKCQEKTLDEVRQRAAKITNPQGLGRKYSPSLYLRVIEHLEQLSLWRIYCLCMLLGIPLDYDNNKQKPIDFIKAEIRACFRDSPGKVMAALRTI